MWEIKILKKDLMPDYLKNATELNDFKAEKWARRGILKLVRHYTWVRVINLCTKCSQTTKTKEKVYQ